MRELIGLVASSKKIEANRNNAQKSSGPKSRRGKSHSCLNALKNGAFAVQRLLPGENAKDYDRLSSRVFAESRPKTGIESMLVDQIVGDMWRLKRVEQAERAYFEQIRASALARALRSLSNEEFQLVPDIVDDEKQVDDADIAGILENAKFPRRYPSQPAAKHLAEGEKPPIPEGAEAMSCSVRQKLQTAIDPDKLMLDAIVSPDRAFPYSTLDHVRRSLVRDILQKDANLAELQGHRLTIGTTR